MVRQLAMYDPVNIPYNKHPKPLFHMNKTEMVMDAKDTPTLHFSDKNISPVDSIGHALLVGKQKDKTARKHNRELMEGFKFHLGKAALASAIEKFYMGTDPSVKSFAKMLAVMGLADVINSQEAIEKLYKRFLPETMDANIRDAVESLITELLINSLVEMRMPNVNDIILFSAPELLDYFVNTDKYASAAQKFEAKYFRY